MVNCLIGLGSNLGSRSEALSLALERFSHIPSARLVATSKYRETSPAGGPENQPAFLNACALLDVSCSPFQLLAALQQIEVDLGRVRELNWGARTIDLDLLLYGSTVLRTAQLELPHSRMSFRRFVLEPAAEIAPAMIHPTSGWTLLRLFEHLKSSAKYIALAGPPGCGKSDLAQKMDRYGLATWLRGPSTDSTSLDLNGELEFARRRAKVVDTLTVSASIGEPPYVITDFWIEQSVVYARRGLLSIDVDRFLNEWEKFKGGLPGPRLVVLFEPLGDALEKRALFSDFQLRSLQAGQGPVLILPSQASKPLDPPSGRRGRGNAEHSSPDPQVQQLKAAIQAMP